MKDHLLGLTGLRPWRCRTCDERFFAWVVPAEYVVYAHCTRCGNLDLQRIHRDRVSEGVHIGLRRKLGVPAYRCEACRRKFFSVRPYRRIVVAQHEAEAHPVSTN